VPQNARESLRFDSILKVAAKRKVAFAVTLDRGKSGAPLFNWKYGFRLTAAFMQTRFAAKHRGCEDVMRGENHYMQCGAS
jgi:hypothetical protein